MKNCSKCRLSKDLDNFFKDKGKKDGYSTVCKICQMRYMAKYYLDHKDKWKDDIKRNKKNTVTTNREKLLNLLEVSQCTDCGEKDVRVLEFDHLSKKKRDVTKLVTHGYSWKTITEEINKCEIVCCNCHRIRTIERAKTYRCESRRKRISDINNQQTI